MMTPARRTLLILLCTAAVPMPIAAVETEPAPDPEMLVDRWTMDDGLPLNVLTGVGLADDGTLWVSSAAGLARFDGREFERFTRSSSPVLTGHRFLELAIGPDGLPWAVSADGAVVRRRQGRFEVWSPGQVLRSPARGFLRSGDKLLLRSETGLYLASPDGLEAAPAESAADPALEAGRAAPEAAPPAAWGGSVWTVDGNLLLRDDREFLTFRRAPTGLAPQGDDALWIATAGEGLLRLRPRPLRAPDLPPIYRDRAVDALLGLRDGSLLSALEMPGRTRLLRIHPQGVDEIFIGPYAERPDENLRVRTLLEDRAGRIWVGTQLGACILDGDTCRFDHPLLPPGNTGTAALFEDRAGRIWAARRDGLFLGTATGESIRWEERRQQDFALSDVRALAEAPDGAVLASTRSGGLLRIDSDGAVERWSTDSGLPANSLRGLHVDETGVAWVGTEDAGLCLLRAVGAGDPGERLIGCVDRSDGLPFDGIYGIVEDPSGRLWLSSNQGLAVLPRSQLDGLAPDARPQLTALVLTERHGLPDRELRGDLFPHLAADRNGRLWFPTEAGPAFLDPSSLPSPEPPPVRIEGITLGGLELRRDPQPVLLPPDARDLALSWTAPDLTWGEQLRFRYRLGDEPWRGPVERRSADWSVLPPGEHVVEVRAGLGGRWGPSASLRVERAPTLRESAAFPWLIALLGVVLTAVLTLGRISTLQARRRELERQVAERTSQLTERNRRIEEQAERLARMDERKTRFVADLSHELRTPLTLVTGLLDDLGDRPESPTDQRSLDLVRSNARRLEELVEQLFDVARLEAGELPLRVRRRDLVALLRAVTERFAARFEAEDVTLSTDLPDTPIHAFVDDDLLDKVFSNLLANAVKFTPEGRTVTVGFPEHGAPGPAEGFVRIQVSDEGPGIPAEERERVFQRFYQADAGDARRHGGAGIGLALVRDLVELHGGSVRLDEAPGGGSRFTVELPLGAEHLAPEEIDLDTPPEPAETPPATASAQGAEADEPDAGRPTLLVVEDHRDMREFLAEHLREHFVVLEAENGAAALDRLAERPVDLVLTDVMMPVMDGLELCRRLRADPTRSGLPVLVLSAKASLDDRVAGLELADDYLSKPFRMPELLARLRALARRAAAAGGAARGSGARPAPGSGLGAASGPGGGTAAATSGSVAPPPIMREVDRRWVERLRAAVEEHRADPGFGVDRLAELMALSRRQLHRECLRLTDTSPSELIRNHRLETAADLLRSGRVATVAEAAAEVGLSPAYFSRLYTKHYGRSPSTDLRESAS